MFPLIHLLASLLLAIFLFKSYGISSLFVFVGGFLTDIDHLLHYYLKFKKLKFKEFLSFYEDIPKTKKYHLVKGDMFVFHSLEFLAVCILLSFYSKIFLIITLGLLLHYILDLSHEHFIMKQPVKGRSFIINYIVLKKQKSTERFKY